MKKIIALMMVIALLAGCGVNGGAGDSVEDEGVFLDKSSYDVLLELYEIAGVDIKDEIKVHRDAEALKWIFELEEMEGFVGCAETDSYFSGNGLGKLVVIEMDSSEGAAMISEKMDALKKCVNEEILTYEIVVRDNFAMFTGFGEEENARFVEAFNNMEFEGMVSEGLENSLDVFTAIFRDTEISMLEFVSYMTDAEKHVQKVNNYINQGEVLEGYSNAVMNNGFFGPATVFVLEMEEGSDIEGTKPKMGNLSRWMVCMGIEEYEIVSNGNYILFAGLTPEENTTLVENFMALEIE
ncbi:hypothetical protein SAMN02745751_00490 [Dethiosulfatibacter aminovorans DSM 17477]|uniref:Uncharacterized protein n=1 Tax=Dethiosulfatibacter aminovorans DSM 17477 TaxID=1121476 RepID=A0A1M6BVV4_9FIRM|nr:hypothetical protein [Dethiosulfatibacter aminovorans]SHI52801.1 hypothetical protein SAMN02745751_00490 [Dethiosulfatibacter aminovorans DSM 17477]